MSKGKEMKRASATSVSLVGALLLACGLSFGSPPAFASDFYAGKTLNFIVATDETGGFSLYAQLIAPYLKRYIPGAPTIVVRNMPGAGGSTAAAYVYSQAPKDGLTIASLTPNSMMDRLFGRKVQDEIDPTKFTYLAGAERGTRVCVTAGASRVKSFNDALAEQAIIGATQPGSPTADYAVVIQRATGAKFRIVKGYSGTGSLYLAMEKGEIDGACGLDWTALKSQQAELLHDNKLNLLVQANIQPDPELARLGVPQPWPFIKNPVNLEAVKLMVDFQQAFGKAYVAPPNVPADRVKILRDGFAAALRDKQLLRDAEKMRLEIAPISGDDVGATVRRLYAAPKEVVDRLKALTADESER